MEKIRVLIVDDSVLIRKLMTDLLSKDPEIEVVGAALNGHIALLKIPILNPHVVTLDIEMPEMDGVATLIEIRKKYPELPVIMCTTLSTEGANAALAALGQGADDYVTKPTQTSSREEADKQFLDQLLPKIKSLGIKNNPQMNSIIQKPLPLTPVPHRPYQIEKIDVVAIGTSTGGPNALKDVIPLIPKNFPVPILIVQHMPPIFTKLLAENLSSKSAIPVKEAADGDEIFPGAAWIAPGNFHMIVEVKDGKKCIKLNQDPHENSCRPAVDVLFRSVAQHYGMNTLAVVMTGMGQDGLHGCESIREQRGQIYVQDEATSIVWGMPGFVAKAGLADKILPLAEIGQNIIQRVNLKRTGVNL